MPSNKTIFIVPVPESGARCTYSGSLPQDGTLWGRATGSPLQAIRSAEAIQAHWGKLLYAPGDSPDLTPETRRRWLRQALALFHWVELKWGTDELSDIPPERRWLKVTLQTDTLENLERQFDEIAQTRAAYYQIDIPAQQSGDELLPLALMSRLRRSDVLAVATGPIGAWTRLIAPRYGFPAIHASLADDPTPDGIFPLRTLIEDYKLTEAPNFTRLFGIAGNPVFHSLSPRLHNASYQQLGLPCFFVPFHINDYKQFHSEVACSPLLEVLGFELSGLTVVSPFKETGFMLADKVVNPVSVRTSSCNMMTRRHHQWIADSTDPLAILEALERLDIRPDAQKVAVVGCGGAGRAIAASLLHAGAEVTLFNRSETRAANASRLLQIPYALLDDLVPSAFDVLVNATPLGKKANERPFNTDLVRSNAVVIDFAYGKETTRTISELRHRGIGCVSGREILIIQVRRQFQVMTGAVMPEELACRLAFGMELDDLLSDKLQTIAI